LLALDPAGPHVGVIQERRPTPAPLLCESGYVNFCVNRPVPPVPEPHLPPAP
jgi:hypothetical protein